jgi:hypothetical protein
LDPEKDRFCSRIDPEKAIDDPSEKRRMRQSRIPDSRVDPERAQLLDVAATGEGLYESWRWDFFANHPKTSFYVFFWMIPSLTFRKKNAEIPKLKVCRKHEL